MLKSRWLIGLFALTFLVAACAAPQVDVQSASLEDASQGVEAASIPTNSPPVASAAEAEYECGDPFNGEDTSFDVRHWEKTDFCQHSVEYSEIFSGGPPPDGIPPIDNPTFETIESADNWLRDVEPIVLLALEDDVRAYPLQIMTWHEIVNDTVNDVPVVVTFCPLCNTALVFERFEHDGELLTFGTSGNLRHSDLVMYDRQTQSWWQQFSGEGIVGSFTGTKLTPVPAAIISWGDFKAKYPVGQVLSIDTGISRPYGQNPYVGYDNIDSYPFLFSGEIPDQLRPMDRVVGVVLDSGDAVAFAFTRLNEEVVINDVIGETNIVVFWKAGTASALDTRDISSGADIGATGVYEATLDGEVLTFVDNDDGTFSDENTGSTWDIFGQAIAGALEGQSLRPINHHDTFWFAWAAFVPGDTLQEG
ncbi:MAG: DUF3179 domain-containing protein [Anaerolineales bacterium]|nr:DUF3179 domain-containing protein [Chloroflexota bacterium]MBL6982110.1 DUF3179 domain-containing protein [Anaerolineales bacterium]